MTEEQLDAGMIAALSTTELVSKVSAEMVFPTPMLAVKVK